MAAEKRQPAQPEAAPRTAKPAPEEFDELRDHVPADIRNVQFPVSVRGYDRDAVDTYVKRVNHVIAELEVSRSPRAAVRHALDRVGKQTVAVLQEARESADKLLEAARDEADAEKERAKAEAAKLVVNASDEADRTKAEADQVLADAKAQASEIVTKAEADAKKRKQGADVAIAAAEETAATRMREIQGDTQAVWDERGRLLEETQAMAQKLQDLAAGAASRLVDDQTEQQTTVTEPQPRKPAATPER